MIQYSMAMLPVLLASNPFGTVDAPPGVANFDNQAGGDIGILVFLSQVISILTVIAGLWVFFNLIFAGFKFVTAGGDAGAYKQVRDSITMSVIGLVLIISAYTIIAILGLLFFGDASYFLNPTLTGPGGST